MKYLLLILVFSTVFAHDSAAMKHETIRYGNFGEILIYKPASAPDALVLFISGESGWQSGVTGMASQLVSQGALTVGIDIRHYLDALGRRQNKCFYPAGDFEELSLYLQKKYKIRNYLKPILMGYSAGASLAYGILAQAPANTFKGAIGMGFSPYLSSSRPLCPGTGLEVQDQQKPGSWYLASSDKLTAPFIVLAGLNDKNCPYLFLENYIKTVPYGELIALPKAGHEIPARKNYLAQLISAYTKVLKSPSYAEIVTARNQQSKPAAARPETDLPLTVLPAMKNDTMPLLVFISGDGGWTSFDEGVAEKLVSKGIPVIGLDAQKYFWQARTPDETSAAVNKVIHYYLGAWNKKSFVVCGYSFGADVVPYIVSRLPADLSHMLKSAVMMSPDQLADFEIHVADMLSFGSSNDKYDVLAEIKKVPSKHLFCIFGQEEDSETSRLFKASGAGIRLLPGNHHYENDFNAVSREIINSFH